MKAVLWESFEIIVNFYQSIIMLYFPFKYLGGKYSDRFVKNHGIIFAYSYSCLKNNIFYKIFASVYPFLIVTLSTVTVFGVASVIFGKPYSGLLVENDWRRLIVLVSIQLLILYAIYVSLNLLRGSHSPSSRLSKTELLLITAILLTTIIIGALLCFVSLDSISENSTCRYPASRDR